MISIVRKLADRRDRGNWGFQVQRLILIAGVIAVNFLMAEVRFLPSPLMKEVAEDLQVGLTTAGNLLSVCMVAAAICMFGVSVVIERIGSVNMLIVSAAAVAVSGLCAWISESFPMALLAYVFCGMSQGIMECISMVLVAQLFSQRYRPLFCSGVCAIAQITSSIAYSLPVFLGKHLGGWRGLELLWGLLAVAVTVILFLFGGRKTIGRENQLSDTASEPGEVPSGKKEKPGLLKALRIRFIFMSVAAMVVFIWVNNHYSIYLPTYLTEVKGFTREEAGLATSLMYICGFSGALLAGIFSVRFRKSIYRYAPLFIMAGGLSLCFLQSTPGILISAGMFGFAYQMWVPMAMSSFMNLEGITTSVLAGATALFNGTGHFLTGLIPTVFTFKLRFMDMNTAYLMTAALLVLPFFLAMTASRLKEFR